MSFWQIKKKDLYIPFNKFLKKPLDIFFRFGVFMKLSEQLLLNTWYLDTLKPTT